MKKILSKLNILGSFKLPEGQSWLGIRQPTATWLKIALGIVPILLVLFLWMFVTSGETPESRIISPAELPSPGEVLGETQSLLEKRDLGQSLMVSLLRVLMGFLVGLAFSFPIGILMGTFSKFKALFDPITVFLAYTPIPALVPLTMSLFGTYEKQKVMFLALAFVIYFLPLMVKAVEDVDNAYLQTSYTMGANRWQILRHVLLPIAFPQIVSAMRFGFGVGWSYIILAEMIAAERGMGWVILMAQRLGPKEHIYLALLVIIMVAYLTDKVWGKLYKYLFPYLEAK